MKKNEFITLTPLADNGNYYHINSMMICSIIGYENNNELIFKITYAGELFTSEVIENILSVFR
jgi:hypothetical protein